jgi:hypothetical protein
MSKSARLVLEENAATLPPPLITGHQSAHQRPHSRGNLMPPDDATNMTHSNKLPGAFCPAALTVLNLLKPSGNFTYDQV